jgi:hypothetical protein
MVFELAPDFSGGGWFYLKVITDSAIAVLLAICCSPIVLM